MGSCPDSNNHRTSPYIWLVLGMEIAEHAELLTAAKMRVGARAAPDEDVRVGFGGYVALAAGVPGKVNGKVLREDIPGLVHILHFLDAGRCEHRQGGNKYDRFSGHA